MHKRGIGRALAGAVFLLQGIGSAQAADPDSTPGLVSEEVVVRGTALWALREDVIKAEDRFYARYNELNKVDDFDVECRWDAPTGTHIKRRGCLTRLAVRAEERYSADYVNFLQGSGPLPDNDPHMDLLRRYEEFRQNVLYLLKTNPELRRLVREREAAVKRYNAERRKRFKGTLVDYR